MKIICKKSGLIIAAAAISFVFLFNAAPTQAACYNVPGPCHYAPCPVGYSVYNNQAYLWSLSPLGWACFPCGGYGCLSGSFWGHVGGPVCATGLLAGSCIDIGPYRIGCDPPSLRCDAECSPAHFSCNAGNPDSNPATRITLSDKWTWICNGTNGGKSVSCAENNCAPNTCVGQTCPNPSGVVPGTKQPDWTVICPQSDIACTLEDCESTIPRWSYGCEKTDQFCGMGKIACSDSDWEICRQKDQGTQTCGACPVDAGGWKEVKPN